MTITDTSPALEARLDQLAAQLTEITGELRRQRDERERWTELTTNLAPLATPAVDTLTRQLQQLDERGYFSFARQAAGIADNVVTSFTEDDVKALGDNIVLILRTVKQMTQPEVMAMLGRAAVTITEGELDGGEPAPSTLALLRQLRDPQVRRGLARALATLRALGAANEERSM